MRYLPLSEKDRAEMLAKIGAKSIDDLFESIPQYARLKGQIEDLPNHQSEIEIIRHLNKMAAKNLNATQAPFFCGAGSYRHFVPSTVDTIIQRSEFLTTYTPYQPEIAQGTLQTLFEFQTQVARLLGCEVANASMYDGSTACAEAVVMAHRINKKTKVVFSGGIHPHYLNASKTLAQNIGIEIIALPPEIDNEAGVLEHLDDDVGAIVVSCPNVFGSITDLSEICAKASEKNIITIGVFTEAFAFGVIEPLGAMGCDIVVGEGQAIGNALNFGGPYVGLFATKEKYMRQMPGRLCGQTTDANGKRGFVLTLSTREQHIRREKATSNICTNSGLCALAFSAHLSLLGQVGLQKTAEKCHEMAVKTKNALEQIEGVKVLNKTFFNEFAVLLPMDAEFAAAELSMKNILGGVPFKRLMPDCSSEFSNIMLIAATELNFDFEIFMFADALEVIINE